MNPLPITGYGSRHRLLFDGDEAKYELWEVKLLGYMRLHKLYDVITPGNDMPDKAKNADAFAELVQCLDDRSLSLVIRDATNDGRKALVILREHYIGKGKPRIISLYTKLTSLKMERGGCLTDYVIQALNTAGEVISDSLLTAMVLKGLPAEYKTFTTVVMQKEQKMTFTEFKVILRSFEENEKCQRTTTGNDDRVMRVQPSSQKSYGANPVMKCYTCGKPGHKSDQQSQRVNETSDGATTASLTHTTQATVGETIRPEQWRTLVVKNQTLMNLNHIPLCSKSVMTLL